eukprot:617225-Hanusia_phi.AAC.5
MFAAIREFSSLAAPQKSEISFGGIVTMGDGSASDHVKKLLRVFACLLLFSQSAVGDYRGAFGQYTVQPNFAVTDK